MRIVRELSGTSIYSNYVWSAFNLVCAKGLRFLGILLCVRKAGVENWGEVASALAIASLLGFVVDQGLGGAPQVYRIKEAGLERAFLLRIALHRLLMSGILLAAAHVLHAIFFQPRSLVLLYLWILIPRALSIDWFFHRRENYHVTQAIASFRTLVFFALAWLVLAPGAGAKVIIAIEIGSEILGALFSYSLLLMKKFSPAPASGELDFRHLLVFSAPLLLMGMIEALPGTLDILLIEHFCGHEAVGQYDIGSKIGMFYFFFGAALVQIILPKLARLNSEGEINRMGDILAASSKVLLMAGAILLLPSFFFPEATMRWIFKQDFPLTVFTFRWIAVWVFVSFASMLNTIVLLSMGRRREYLRGTLFVALANVACNALLIWRFGGQGVVFSRIFAELLLGAYAFALLPKALRMGYRRAIGAQTGSLILMLACMVLSEWTGMRWLFFLVATAICTGILALQGTFSRNTWKTLTMN